jgi:hypothetical protein
MSNDMRRAVNPDREVPLRVQVGEDLEGVEVGDVDRVNKDEQQEEVKS